MNLIEIIFGTPLYHESYLLRDEYLRKPLGLKFNKADIEKEYRDKHWGLVDDHGVLIASLMYSHHSDQKWKMRQVVVDEAYRKKGVGRLLIELSEQAMQNQYGLQEIELSARVGVVHFYERLAYVKVGKEFTEIGIPHQKMKKAF